MQAPCPAACLRSWFRPSSNLSPSIFSSRTYLGPFPPASSKPTNSPHQQCLPNPPPPHFQRCLSRNHHPRLAPPRLSPRHPSALHRAHTHITLDLLALYNPFQRHHNYKSDLREESIERADYAEGGDAKGWEWGEESKGYGGEGSKEWE